MKNRKQHIVPETYLKYFSPLDDGKNIHVLHIYNKYKNKIELRNSGDSIFWKKNFYTSQKTNPPNALELFLGQNVENNYNSIIKRLREEQSFTDDIFKLKIFEWVYYSNLRSPIWRDFFKSLISKNKGPEISNEEVREEHIRLFFDKEISDFIVKYYSDELSPKRWTVLINSSDFFWISSDNPGFCFNYTDIQKNPTSFYINPLWINIQYDTILYYPLSKNYCLKIEPYTNSDAVELNFINDSIRFQKVNSKEILLINNMTVRTASDYIFSSDTKELLEYEKIKQHLTRTV